MAEHFTCPLCQAEYVEEDTSLAATTSHLDSKHPGWRDNRKVDHGEPAEGVPAVDGH